MGSAIFALLISIGLPLIVFIYSFIKKYYLPFILGILAFMISQMCIRIPLLQYLELSSTSYLMFQAKHPVIFSILLALSAGVFEEFGRFMMMRFFMRQKNWTSGFFFGAGHGGIEAILFVGISVIIVILSPTTPYDHMNFFLGGVERFFAMLLHIGLSIIVLRAVIQNKFIFVIIAILIHSFVNSLIGIFPLFMPSQVALTMIEASLAVTAIIVFIYCLFMKRKGILH